MINFAPQNPSLFSVNTHISNTFSYDMIMFVGANKFINLVYRGELLPPMHFFFSKLWISRENLHRIEKVVKIDQLCPTPPYHRYMRSLFFVLFIKPGEKEIISSFEKLKLDEELSEVIFWTCIRKLRQCVYLSIYGLMNYFLWFYNTGNLLSSVLISL